MCVVCECARCVLYVSVLGVCCVSVLGVCCECARCVLCVSVLGVCCV